MKINAFFYSIKQGITSIFRTKWFTLASVATICSCLFLFGILFSIVMTIRQVVQNVEEGVSVTVFFEEGITDERIEEIGNIIIKRTEVARIEFISADEAWENFATSYFPEFMDGFTENPLEDSESYDIYINDVNEQDRLVSFLETLGLM